ncbi:garvicin Q family class II bacteriocin, partial [Lactobacillus crispatus]|uniref:garvicin Q family class II bacteriocin n=1 Tax=Lactobacillus crispatus TaxID=47770 RepID=UPI0022E2F9CF
GIIHPYTNYFTVSTFVKGKKRKHRKSHGYIVGYGSNGYCYKDSKGNFHYYVTKSPLQTVLDVNRQGLESALGGGWVQAPENAHWHGFEYHR